MVKLKKMPKRPKERASLETWKRYEERCRIVAKENDAIKRREQEKKRIIEKTRKKV